MWEKFYKLYKILLCILIFMLVFTTFFISQLKQRTRFEKYYSNKHSLPPRGYLVYTNGCNIPDMDLYGPSINQFFQLKTIYKCNTIPPLVESNLTHIWVVENALKHYFVNRSDLICGYEEVLKDENKKSGSFWEDVRFSSNFHFFYDPVKVDNEVVHVVCKKSQVMIYEDFHSFILLKNSEVTIDEKSLSLLIIGVDSLSRLNFYRQMPRTRNLLNYLGAIELKGYNKVGDNTFQNLLPLLSGYFDHELLFCWPDQSHYFDNCPWIWKIFHSLNYTTSFGEDYCHLGLFTSGKKGFRNPPTDYHAETFIYNSETYLSYISGEDNTHCNGHRFSTDVLLNYAHKFTTTMVKNKKKFWGFFWETSLTHDFLNAPPEADDIYNNFFLHMEQEGLLEHTAVFFMSDHGARWGDFRDTHQGRIEENLPFLFVILPSWFEDKYSYAVRNLKQNAYRLTTHFDTHETMKDLCNLEAVKFLSLKHREETEVNKRGYSLFLPRTLNRTCKSAGIKPSWCTCYIKKKISVTHKSVSEAVHTTVKHLNDKLRPYKKCAQLKLYKITSAYVDVESKNVTFLAKRGRDYVVVFITEPGKAKFESTVRQIMPFNEMIVVGEVSRINRYGNQSACLDKFRLKRFCYCINENTKA